MYGNVSPVSSDTSAESRGGQSSRGTERGRGACSTVGEGREGRLDRYRQKLGVELVKRGKN